jgi:PAS domain S-box-containing protein
MIPDTARNGEFEAPVILLADDEPGIREFMTAVLSAEGYRLVVCVDGQEALAKAAETQPDAILLDVMMPGMSGFDVCRRLREDPQISGVPILMLTALDDRQTKIQGLEAGADDFMSKPIDLLELRTRLRTITRLNRYRSLLRARRKYEHLVELSPDGILLLEADGTIQFTNAAVREMLRTNGDVLEGRNIDAFVGADTWSRCRTRMGEPVSAPLLYAAEGVVACADGSQKPIELRLGTAGHDKPAVAQLIVRDITERHNAEQAVMRAHQDLLAAYESTLEGWSRALELRDRETEGHTQRVTRMTLKLARLMGMDENDLVHVRRGALLHDIGKLGVPDAILLKPGPLTDDEWVIMRMHVTYARDLLLPIEYLRLAMDIPYRHHEKWDGTGYPEGLKGEEIPLPARIFAIVDVWDALRSDRPYRPAWPVDKVRNYVAGLSGKHFDPAVVEAFLKGICELEAC